VTVFGGLQVRLANDSVWWFARTSVSDWWFAGTSC
jgi:hypothetical protein